MWTTRSRSRRGHALLDGHSPLEVADAHGGRGERRERRLNAEREAPASLGEVADEGKASAASRQPGVRVRRPAIRPSTPALAEWQCASSGPTCSKQPDESAGAPGCRDPATRSRARRVGGRRGGRPLPAPGRRWTPRGRPAQPRSRTYRDRGQVASPARPHRRQEVRRPGEHVSRHRHARPTGRRFG